jgi:hypothetical protein
MPFEGCCKSRGSLPPAAGKERIPARKPRQRPAGVGGGKAAHGLQRQNMLPARVLPQDQGGGPGMPGNKAREKSRRPLAARLRSQGPPVRFPAPGRGWEQVITAD